MAERDEEMIRGTVQSIVFQNAENGYTVLRLRTEGGDQITVTGTIPMTLVGERLVIAGNGDGTRATGRSLRRSFWSA